MRTRSKLLALSLPAFAVFAFAFPASPNEAPSYRQKIGVYLKEKGKEKAKSIVYSAVVDKVVDHFAQKIVDFAARHGAPYRKDSGDYDVATTVVGDIIDPRGWEATPYERAKMMIELLAKSSTTASSLQDTPGMHYDRKTHQWVQSALHASVAPVALPTTPTASLTNPPESETKNATAPPPATAQSNPQPNPVETSRPASTPSNPPGLGTGNVGQQFTGLHANDGGQSRQESPSPQSPASAPSTPSVPQRPPVSFPVQTNNITINSEGHGVVTPKETNAAPAPAPPAPAPPPASPPSNSQPSHHKDGGGSPAGGGLVGPSDHGKGVGGFGQPSATATHTG